jgi:hypothetical protein
MLVVHPVFRPLGVVALLALFPFTCSAQVSLPLTDERVAAAEEKIEAALQQNVAFSFPETPLKEVIEAIKTKTGLPIVLDTKKLEEAAINLDTPVTVSLRNLTLDSFLRNTLSDLNLTYLVRDEAIHITTPEDAGSQLIHRIYPVLDLVARRTPVFEASAVVTSRTAGGRMGTADYESLINVITTTIDPDSWDDVGGPGSIASFDNAGALIIAQTHETHQKIGPLLNSLRKVKGLQGLPTITPPARVSMPVLAKENRDAARERLSSTGSAPARRRMTAPQHSWQVPQVYEE